MRIIDKTIIVTDPYFFEILVRGLLKTIDVGGGKRRMAIRLTVDEEDEIPEDKDDQSRH